jgi:hypothetical protein
MAAMIDFFGLGLAMLTGFHHFFLVGLPGTVLIGFWLGGKVRLGHWFSLGSASAKLRCAAWPVHQQIRGGLTLLP